MLSTVNFGDPANYFTVKGGTLNRDRTHVVAAVSRILEKEVQVGIAEYRKDPLSVQLVISCPVRGFTAADVDTLAEEISTFLTSDNLDRLLNGES